jgi:hypothetical protein
MPFGYEPCSFGDRDPAWLIRLTLTWLFKNFLNMIIRDHKETHDVTRVIFADCRVRYVNMWLDRFSLVQIGPLRTANLQ